LKMSERKTLFTIERERTDRHGNTHVKKEPNWTGIIKTIIGAVVIFIAIAILWPARIVGPTERGVVKTFGEVQDIILEPGLRFRVPIMQSITTYDLTPTIVNINIPVGTDGALSRDRQTIGIKGSYNWKFNEEDIVDIARRFSSISSITNQANNIINTAIKNVVGRYDIANIVQDQVAISQSARQLAIEQLNAAKIPIEITALNLNNWDWSADYDAMIRRTIEEQQAVFRASAEADRVEQENRRLRIEAEAQAAANIAIATGERDAANLRREAAILTAQGTAEANRLIAASITPTLLELRRIEIAQVEAGRWDGVRVPGIATLNPLTGIINTPQVGR